MNKNPHVFSKNPQVSLKTCGSMYKCGIVVFKKNIKIEIFGAKHFLVIHNGLIEYVVLKIAL